jgi:hypothetical protein
MKTSIDATTVTDRRTAREWNSLATVLRKSSEDDSQFAGVRFNGLFQDRSRGILFPGAAQGGWLRLLLLFVLYATAAQSAAQESPAQWIARIFDPATLGITPFPGAELNRKQSVDAIVLERGGDKRIAIFIMPLDQLKAAADHFAKQFSAQPTVTGADSPYVAYTFDFTDAKTPGAAAPKRTGLQVVVSRAQFVDGKGQITMQYQPPKPK